MFPLAITDEEAALLDGRSHFKNVAEYHAVREKLIAKERARYFDAEAASKSSWDEQRAAGILKLVQESDQEQIYRQARHANGLPRHAAGPFLENVDLINQTRVLKMAQMMPKGSHLHIHFNACLPPSFLIQQARNMDAMYIKSSLPLNSQTNMDACEIQFEVLSPPAEVGDLLSDTYPSWSWMKYQDFLARYPGGIEAAETWLESKVVLTEGDAYAIRQTVNSVWNKFGACTRFMKGLFAYESAFRAYTRALVLDLVHDNIQYAEIRPNFPVNFTVKDDASGTLTTHDLCQIIIDEVNDVKATLQPGDFFDLRVIYAAPKLGPNGTNMARNLAETLALKQAFPNLICGFDMVGPEETLRKIKDYLPELLHFKDDCRKAGIEIPFLFHAGETLQDGTDTDGNLYDCLMLGCPRIGHGFALAKHPELLDQFKQRGICLELCPISNELLHLCPSVAAHSMYTILSHGVHCTLSSDNGTIFRSTLSHDFYQFFIGSNNSTLFGWKTLALWSIEHSCVNETEKAQLKQDWQTRWDSFISWVIDSHTDERRTWDAAHPLPGEAVKVDPPSSSITSG